MSTETNKITDIIKRRDVSYSFEVTPDIKLDELEKLSINPSFYSITWHAKSHDCESLDIRPLAVAKSLKSKGKEVLLHLSCDLLKKEYLKRLLQTLQENLICNILVVRGEGYEESTSEFKTTQDLITYIRKQTGDYFCIGVAGFPTNSRAKMQHLKDKIDAGADFILTQAIFELDEYKKIVNDSKSIGINVPIIPGVYIFDTYDQLKSFTKLCKIDVSEQFLENVRERKQGEVSIILKKLFQDIQNEGNRPLDFHVFTLNNIDRANQLVNVMAI